MDSFYLQAPHTSVRWNRKLLNAYWTGASLSFTAELFSSFTSEEEYSFFLLRYMLLPTLSMVLVIGAAELLNTRMKRGNDYLMTTTCLLLAFILIGCHPKIDYIFALSLFPFLVAISYFRKSHLLYACIGNIATFYTWIWIQPVLQERTSPTEMVVMPVIQLGATYISLKIMNRGVEILRALQSSDKLARTDALTELYNHKTFHEYLDSLIGQSDQSGLPLHLALLDIDGFKGINDTFGHWAGDRILGRVADVIRTTVTPDDFVARYGGEEFALIFTNKTADEALQLADLIRHRISELPHPELEGKCVTVSIGFRSYSSGDGKEKLFKGADTLLYAAKNSGKNRTIA